MKSIFTPPTRLIDWQQSASTNTRFRVKFSPQATPISFSATFVLLQQESFLARGSLAVGLTALRTAIFPDMARFYSGFFNTSIALERIMKLIVVADHMIQQGYAVPTKQDLKTYGHDLVTLYSSCVSAATRAKIKNVAMPTAGSIESEILDFLSEFAKQSRYYNLDALRTLPANYSDPLDRWAKILNEVLNKDAPKAKVTSHLAQADALHQMLKKNVCSVQHGMDGTLLSLEQVFSLPAMHGVAVPYTMVRLFNLLTPLLTTIGELGNQGFSDGSKTSGPHIPLFSEFFVHFGGSDSEIRRKKRWP